LGRWIIEVDPQPFDVVGCHFYAVNDHLRRPLR
jgi:hypothetical protein